jgi:ABC-type transporter Mla MlaB component
MKDALADFEQTIAAFGVRLRALSAAEAARARTDGKWTAKQIIGHLIDSAANNHQRFVLAQLKDELRFPGYQQEDWVRVQHYDAASWPVLVQLWESYNRQLLHIMAHTPPAKLHTLCTKHTLDRSAWQTVSESDPVTLEYLMRDYIGHMQHHLRQIFDEE